MRFNKEENLIELSLYELVATARRRMSVLPIYDEDEPSFGSSRRISEELSLIFEEGGMKYRLSIPASLGGEGDILIERTVSTSAQRPRKEEVAEIRGEGYVTAYAYAEKMQLPYVDITFVYISEITGERVVKSERAAFKKLDAFFKKCTWAISAFAAPEIQRVTERLPSLKELKFPYKAPREAQREFISSAYRVLSRGGKLYACAPTGTGKTVSALYPALRALGDGKIDKIFYLTPKTTTAMAASDCLELMAERGAKLRAAVISAKDRCCTEGRVCKTSRKLCVNSACNRLSEAALELFDANYTVVDDKKAAPVSKKYSVCPYELSLAYSELCDVIICDFNYLFDPFVFFKRYFSRGGRFAFLVDEAHNLPERIRSAYSAELPLSELSAPFDAEVLGPFSKTKQNSKKAAELLEGLLYPLVKEEIRDVGNGVMSAAAHSRVLPEGIYSVFGELIGTVEGEIYDNFRAEDEEKDARLNYLNDYYYKIKRFNEILNRFDDAFEMFVFYEDGRITIKLFCLDTGAIIKDRLEKGHSALLFSGTLSPLNYYKATLGGDRPDEAIEVESPFAPEQLSVNIMDKISTRFSEREDTISAVLRVIAATISARRGNYMVFSPSFAYSEALEKRFREKYPKLRVISQKKDMTKKQKEEFLKEFEREDKSYLVAFAVMGGIYSEGIDLTGDKLIGAVIVGIGLPGLSYEREAIAAYYEEKYEEGKQYAYIYPGMNRVFQAAGRVIRREEDRGVIVLIDDRFDDPIYKKSLPSLWSGVKFLSDAKELKGELDEFWKEEN